MEYEFKNLVAKIATGRFLQPTANAQQKLCKTEPTMTMLTFWKSIDTYGLFGCLKKEEE